jgi:hypothetical protein
MVLVPLPAMLKLTVTAWVAQLASIRAARKVHTLVAVLHWPFLPESGASAVELTVKVTAGAAPAVGATAAAPVTTTEAPSATVDKRVTARAEARRTDLNIATPSIE